ncbi:Bax inhibitor-1/YccA family protein [Runella sp. MFBS21]|uniref:Bax inhibitor-1/YccA family protein n=1 Tax=Runella sp. MFBS21 TaxID=3034018 RepID=UPI0023FA17E2|nr:Bax inhibitor-1/YccA family protein [Runella sp. MFBS21]MDF7816082.1 Bax inhibitor-1/YccA family protein [Runella sp. MFBS21]
MANPTLSEKSFIKAAQEGVGQSAMTVQGTVNKIIIMGALVIASAAASWFLLVANPGLIMPLAIGGSIAGLVVALILAFKQHLAPTLAPLYAVVEGVFVGAITLVFESMYPGIGMSAALLTFAILAGMVGLYKAGVIRATPTFKRVIFAATAGVAIFYLVAMVLRMFSIDVPLIYDSGWFGIGFSLFVVGLAAFNLVIDLDTIEQGAAYGAPKYMEWYCAFGMIVTIVWLYVEVLRLLAKLSSRD